MMRSYGCVPPGTVIQVPDGRYLGLVYNRVEGRWVALEYVGPVRPSVNEVFAGILGVVAAVIVGLGFGLLIGTAFRFACA